MNNSKTSTQNFDSSYVYKVEEREGSEKIIHESHRGLVSIENNELPKVTRYFLKNNKGEPQGYIERKLIQNYNAEIIADDKEFNPQSCKNEKIILQTVPHKEHLKEIKVDSQVTLNTNAKLPYNFHMNSKRFCRPRHKQRYHEKVVNKIGNCVPLDSKVFDQSKQHTLGFTSSTSTPSERTFAMRNTVRTTDIPTERKIEQNPSKEKFYFKKSQTIFRNDPNKRLKNLFTIVQPNENVNFSKSYDMDLLNKTKELLVKLIDEELQRVQRDDGKNAKLHQGNEIDKRVLKTLKLECIGKITEELELIKRLENCSFRN